MSKEKSNTVRLGIFVVVTFILFSIGVYNIGNKQNLFGKTFIISSTFNNVNGLQIGNNVRYAGIDVGRVSQITLSNDSVIRVDMQLQRKVQAFLKKDAIASIGSDGLVGNMIVNISPGTGNGGTVEDGDILKSYTRIEAEEVLEVLGNTTENVALLTLNVLQIAESINKGKGSLPMLIKDSLVAEDLRWSVRHLRQTTQNINSMSRQLQADLESIREGNGLLGYLLTDSTFESQINQITGQLDQLASTRVAPILDNLEQSSREINHTSEALKTLVEQIDLNQGLVGTVLHDSTVVYDLKQTMRNLNEGTSLFNENMEALKHHFLFKKYFRQQEKEGRKKDKAPKAVDGV